MQVRVIERVPLPRRGPIAGIALHERQLPDGACGGDRLGRGKRSVQQRDLAGARHEAWLRERIFPAREAEEEVHGHGPVEVVVDEPEDDDIRSKRADVAHVAQVCLIDAIRLDAEVEHLDVGAERALEPVSPGILVADVEAERERVADQRDPVAAAPVGQGIALGCAADSLDAARVPAVGAPPIGSEDPAQQTVRREVRALASQARQRRRVARGDVAPAVRQQDRLAGHDAARRARGQQSDGHLTGGQEQEHREGIERDREAEAPRPAGAIPQRDDGGGGERGQARDEEDDGARARRERHQRASVRLVRRDHRQPRRCLEEVEGRQQRQIGRRPRRAGGSVAHRARSSSTRYTTIRGLA